MIPSFKKFVENLKSSYLGASFEVSQGEHSKETPRRRFSLGPAFQVSQGEHSKSKDVKEDTESKTSYTFLNDMNSTLNDKPHDEVQKELQQHYLPHTNPHWKHLDRYTMGSSQLNKHLFDHHSMHNDPYHPITDVVHRDQVAGLDQALAHTQLNRPLSVMSGLKKNPGLLMGANKRMYHPSYLSTTIKPTVAEDFANRLSPGTNEPHTINHDYDHHYLMAHLEPGQHGYYVGSRSNYDHEHEFVMPRRSIFHVQDHEMHELAHAYAPDRKAFLHIWHARVINPDGKP